MNYTTPVSITSLPGLSTVHTRSSGLETTAFSPVNENGSFEFDRIIRAGELLKKGKKTRTYKAIHLVLRPYTISIYTDSEHTKLRHNVNLADITAVARKKDSKRPHSALFTIFTPPRNFHFEAKSQEEADDWVHLIRSSAKVDEWENILGSSDDDAEASAVQHTTFLGRKPSAPGSRPPHHGRLSISARSFTSISSAGAANFPGSSISLSLPPADIVEVQAEVEQERVLKNGKLFLLKSKRGVKKWKPVWAVLRSKSLAIYPNESVLLSIYLMVYHTD
jgi:hypothetical protein